MDIKAMIAALKEALNEIKAEMSKFDAEKLRRIKTDLESALKQEKKITRNAPKR